MPNFEFSTFLTKQFETRSNEIGKSVRTTAANLHTIAEQLREDAITSGAADFADQGADFIDHVGSYLEASSLSKMAADAEDFSRERPMATASIGIATGLLAARLLKSTAARRQAARPGTSHGI